MKSIIQIFLVFGLMPLFSSFTRPTSSVEMAGRGPLITATVTTSTYCKSGNSCANWQMAQVKRHGFKITLTGASITFYNSNFVYNVYEGTDPYMGTSQIIAPLVASFPCTQNVVEFASGQFKNNTDYSVLIDASGSNGLVTFKTGAGAGTSCIQKVDNNTVKKN